jgi:hypothetical protein
MQQPPGVKRWLPVILRIKCSGELREANKGLGKFLEMEQEGKTHICQHRADVEHQASWVDKLRYIHRNPVKRDLCSSPEDWQWSSFRHYATGIEGVVQIESQWTASRRERAGFSLRVRELPRSSQNRA